MQRRSIHTPQRTSDTLARYGPDELTRALIGRDLLLTSARVLAEILDHEPERGDYRDADWRDLVHRLASVEVGRGTSYGTVRSATAIRHFEVALTEAVDAVRRCRQTEHGAGRCWFTSLPNVDGCGEVLRAAHRLG